ncbi:MAG: hypothetical protein K6A65_06300 [Succinivibrionaceae bacterium]|nr:hypothetical protein [Succinivibrionaceae bacterium]
MDPFSILVRVYYEDTDAGQIVYHANYLTFCARARSEWRRGAGAGEPIALGAARCKFVRPSRLDDLLTVTCEPQRDAATGRVVGFRQEVLGADGGRRFLMEGEIEGGAGRQDPPAPAFAIKVRAYGEDTGAGDEVRPVSYLRYCERARTDWLRGAGVAQGEGLVGGNGYVIGSMRCALAAPSRLDELLTVTCAPSRIGQASLTFWQEVRGADGTLRFTMEGKVAYLRLSDGVPQRIPAATLDYARQADAGHEGRDC